MCGLMSESFSRMTGKSDQKTCVFLFENSFENKSMRWKSTFAISLEIVWKVLRIRKWKGRDERERYKRGTKLRAKKGHEKTKGSNLLAVLKAITTLATLPPSLLLLTRGRKQLDCPFSAPSLFCFFFEPSYSLPYPVPPSFHLSLTEPTMVVLVEKISVHSKERRRLRFLLSLCVHMCFCDRALYFYPPHFWFAPFTVSI